jgi:hypothetical protein
MGALEGMPTNVAVSRTAVWGLWCCVTLAALGLVLVFTGAVAHRTETIWPGGALMAFAVMLYLILHFWSTAAASFASTRPTPAPVAAPMAKLRAHAVPPPVKARGPRLFNEGVGWEASPKVGVEETLEAAPVPVALATNGHSVVERPRVSAMERRKEWIDQMPMAKDILGTPAPSAPVADSMEGKTRGRCGGCNTILVAPAARPIRLRCPTCGKVAWIK